MNDQGHAAALKQTGDSSSRFDSNEIYSRIFDAIVDNRLAPGTHLKEDELCDLFGVGRTRIRTALSRLASDHVIELVANRGAFVSRPSVEEAREVFRARRVMEGHLIRRAAERHDPAMAMALTDHLHGEDEARAAGDTARIIRRCGRYHQVLADQADSPIMAGFVRELIARSSLIIAIYETEQPDACEMDEHRKLSELVLAGNADEAVRLMDSHLKGIEARLDLDPKTDPVSDLRQSLGLA
ncbi:GntR family transcriptional regulator [Aestuariicoccus sp. MJ-SS9]|uniref:GntR family transcriptional regulator n=1 Tax=Aestuariicoccus sp. MJ-SS9 TaxID=3079855 RepID=UPI00290A17BF|nr:GntR family transcriptional regulator [Aestuariicoccus sp. MJ-SS9]MDU8913914.1 GntR family transcriptional regulator [Aestuariicoccus sp. MJ-SS9]